MAFLYGLGTGLLVGLVAVVLVYVRRRYIEAKLNQEIGELHDAIKRLT